MATIDQIAHTEWDRPTVAVGARAAAERAARASLRAQIAKLDRELATIVAASRLRLDPEPRSPAGPRLLGLGDLERERDRLVRRVATLRAAASVQAARHHAARAELERMLADPPAHKWRRLSNADLGRPGCTTYHVRPRAGVLGMLMGWWRVKVSGGCPLGLMGKRSRQRPAPAPARDERPRAPWDPFPLVELCALLGIVLLVLGLINFDEERGPLLLVTGMALGSLAGLDTVLREHFAGYRSHSTVLAGIPAVVAAAALYFAGAPWPALVLAAVVAFAAGFKLFARAYERRAR